jgi:hypothetical protein
MRLSPFWLHFNKKCMSKDNSKKQAPGGGNPCSTLPVPLIVNVLSRIPILKLRRLRRKKVSPYFSAAMKRTFGEIALKCQEAILEADRSGDKETVAYKQSYKARYLLSDVPEWQVETAYSAPDCCWRDKPLSSSPPDHRMKLRGCSARHLDKRGLEVPAGNYSKPLGERMGPGDLREGAGV